MEKIFTWTNPVEYAAAGMTPMRDPFILKEGGLWYMTGSLPPYAAAGERPGEKGAQRVKGVPLYKSADLLHWTFVDHIIPAPEDMSVWYTERFWAPELFAHNGKYYVTVNCSPGRDGALGCLLASAENIEGPYTILTPEAPLVSGNDAHLYADENGETWLFWDGVWCAKVDLDAPCLLTEKRRVIRPVPNSDAWNAEREGIGFEGPFVLRRNGVCYLFYSTWTRGYEVGAAVAESVTGEWRMLPEPVYGAQDPSWCRLWGAAYQPGYYAAEGTYGQCGHNCVFEGPDGEAWIAAHSYDVSEDPFGNVFDVKLVIDRLAFDESRSVMSVDVNTGRPVNGPTEGTSVLRYDPRKADEARAPLCAPDVWLRTDGRTGYSLPGQVDIRLKNGFRAFAPVVWQRMPQPDACGEQCIPGTAHYAGREYPVTAHVLGCR